MNCGIYNRVYLWNNCDIPTIEYIGIMIYKMLTGYSFIPQKRSLFLLSCSPLLQTTWTRQRSTPPTRLCVCFWKGSAAWSRWRNAEKPVYWSDWSGLPWRSTTRYGEGERRWRRCQQKNLHWRSRVWRSVCLIRFISLVLQVLDDGHRDEEPGGGPASSGAAEERGRLCKH